MVYEKQQTIKSGQKNESADKNDVREAPDPKVEEAYWREHYKTRPYVKSGKAYEDYAPAYRYGWESGAKPENTNRKFEDLEADLEMSWPSYRGPLAGMWKDVRDAARDAYERARPRKVKSRKNKAFRVKDLL